jgi:hypothetical protein
MKWKAKPSFIVSDDDDDDDDDVMIMMSLAMLLFLRFNTTGTGWNTFAVQLNNNKLKLD